jgi:putrescine aminotransferase
LKAAAHGLWSGTTDAIFHAARGDTPRTPFGTATFAGNGHASVAGIAALQILVDEDLPRRAAESGAYLLESLRQLKQQHPLIADVRGLGLMIGIEFAPATRGLGTVLSAGMLNRLSHTYMSSLVLLDLYQEHRILTAYTLNDMNVLRFQPPLDIAREHLDYVVDSLDQTLTRLKNFPQAALQTLWQLSVGERDSAIASSAIL